MSENNLKKPFTIRDVLITDIDAFHNKRGEIGLSGAGYFHSLLHGKEVKPSSDLITKDEGRNTNNEEVESLRTENEKLKNKLSNLQTNFDLLLVKRSELEDENKMITTNLIELKESQLKLTSLDYIMTLDLETAKKINRAIALDRKEGLLKNVPVKNYLQNFTMKCLKYTIKNEY